MIKGSTISIFDKLQDLCLSQIVADLQIKAHYNDANINKKINDCLIIFGEDLILWSLNMLIKWFLSLTFLILLNIWCEILQLLKILHFKCLHINLHHQIIIPFLQFLFKFLTAIKLQIISIIRKRLRNSAFIISSFHFNPIHQKVILLLQTIDNFAIDLFNFFHFLFNMKCDILIH